MAIGVGTRLGSYEVLAAIGAGGMGEVYRAHDTKLNRDIALKVLPETFTLDPDRLARFKREAQVLASLNHPNIAAIYGLEESGSVRALVLELVEGPTLAELIARAQGSRLTAHGPDTLQRDSVTGPKPEALSHKPGPSGMPLEEVLPIARQICEALEAAHEHGIVHRDLKPANIKLRVRGAHFSGHVGPHPHAQGGSGLPPRTEDGRLGTAAYMSPEQARGKTVDKRADIRAFGCVLYEMLTGRRAFAGEDVSETLAAVIKGEPDWNALPANTPAAVRRLLRRCLRKDGKDRLHDISDARIEMQDAQAEATSEGTTVPVPLVTRRSRERLAWTVAALLAVVSAVAVAIVLLLRPIPDAPEMRLEVTTPATSSPLHFAISPDGGRLVFVASGDGQPRLWVRALDAVAAQPLTGTENAEYPFWSPDSRSIGFFAGGKLRRSDIAGGPPQALADAPAGRGGAWNPDDTILFAASNAGPLLRVSARAGESSAVTRIVPGHLSHRYPQFLPDGQHFLFFVQGNAAIQGIYLGSLDGGEPRRLVANDTAGAWAPPGRMFFVRQGALVATPFDAEKGAFTGGPITVADPVAFDAAFNLGGFSVSAAGRVAYRAGGSERRQLTWYARDGKPVGTAGEPDENTPQFPELSPDGRRVAITRTVQSNFDVWLIDLMRGGRTRFTFDAANDNSPLWSPDGTRITFQSNRKGAYDLYVKPSSGAGSEELLWESTSNKAPLSWSSDGRFLLFWDVAPKTNFDLWTQPMMGDRKAVPWLNTPFTETGGQFSPDGRWVAYQSNESGPFEIYVQPFPAASAKWQISTNGGSMPRWRTDGKELFFIAPDAKLMAAAVTASESTLEAAPPVALFQTRMVGGPSQILKHQYAVSRDGRFLINEPAEASTATPITLILNWKPRS